MKVKQANYVIFFLVLSYFFLLPFFWLPLSYLHKEGQISGGGGVSTLKYVLLFQAPDLLPLCNLFYLMAPALYETIPLP
jgi:hypothetical protein